MSFSISCHMFKISFRSFNKFFKDECLMFITCTMIYFSLDGWWFDYWRDQRIQKTFQYIFYSSVIRMCNEVVKKQTCFRLFRYTVNSKDMRNKTKNDMLNWCIHFILFTHIEYVSLYFYGNELLIYNSIETAGLKSPRPVYRLVEIYSDWN